MSNKLQILVTNIDPSTSEEELDALFADFGEVEETYLHDEPVIGDRSYAAIITMVDEDEAQEAFQEMKGEWLDGRQINIAWFNGEKDENLFPEPDEASDDGEEEITDDVVAEEEDDEEEEDWKYKK
ncbi:MAG: RNA recognition motif domain-containing protein [Bacteroidia bacterium]